MYCCWEKPYVKVKKGGEGGDFTRHFYVRIYSRKQAPCDFRTLLKRGHRSLFAKTERM